MQIATTPRNPVPQNCEDKKYWNVKFGLAMLKQIPPIEIELTSHRFSRPV